MSDNLMDTRVTKRAAIRIMASKPCGHDRAWPSIPGKTVRSHYGGTRSVASGYPVDAIMRMAAKRAKDADLASYCDREGVLDELSEDDVVLSLDEELHWRSPGTSP